MLREYITDTNLLPLRQVRGRLVLESKRALLLPVVLVLRPVSCISDHANSGLPGAETNNKLLVSKLVPSAHYREDADCHCSWVLF